MMIYFVKHLEEKYGIPYLLKHMPIGIENTNAWLRDIAAFFGLQEQAEQLIQQENAELKAALAEYLPAFQGKKVFLGAGEFRALATALLMHELGFKIIGIRSYHHDEFAESEYEKLVKISTQDFVFNIANVQPFEEANLLKKIAAGCFFRTLAWQWHGLQIGNRYPCYL